MLRNHLRAHMCYGNIYEHTCVTESSKRTHALRNNPRVTFVLRDHLRATYVLRDQLRAHVCYRITTPKTAPFKHSLWKILLVSFERISTQTVAVAYSLLLQSFRSLFLNGTLDGRKQNLQVYIRYSLNMTIEKVSSYNFTVNIRNRYILLVKNFKIILVLQYSY